MDLWGVCGPEMPDVIPETENDVTLLYTAWWFGTWLDDDFPFSWEWNVIIPTDFHSIIFQRGWLKPPTRKPHVKHHVSNEMVRSVEMAPARRVQKMFDCAMCSRGKLWPFQSLDLFY